MTASATITPTEAAMRFVARTALVLCLVAASATSLRAAAGAPQERLAVTIENALSYLRGRQNDDGSFGSPERPRLQTSLAVLAFLSTSADLPDDDAERIERAVRWLLRGVGDDGDLGDRAYPVESHALATTALICAAPHLRDEALQTSVLETIDDALTRLRRMQDRSSSSASRGGWKLEGFKGEHNDRRTSTWALLCYDAARSVGADIGDAYVERGFRYVAGSFKRSYDEETEHPDQVGGFSYEEEGKAVPVMSAMGGWALARFGRRDDDTALNIAWLERHPPPWSGPNYFYTNFFRVRALKFGDPTGEAYARAVRRLFIQLRDNQAGDGQIAFPPVSYESEGLGPVYSTALAVLILDIDDSRLVFDEDFRVRPLFE